MIHRFPTTRLVSLLLLAAATSGFAQSPNERPSKDSWTIAVIPDTQYYVNNEDHAPYFTEMTRWLVKQRKKYHIQLVLHVGDIVDGNRPEQWERAKESLEVLDGKLPYVLAVGNHDLGHNSSDRSTMLNDYFKISDNRLNEQIFGGAFEEGRLENAWYHFEHGGRKYVIFSLEFGPRREVVQWAGKVADRHPDESYILVTHEFIDQESTLFSDDGLARRTTRQTKNSPYSYGISKDGNVHCGSELWDAFVSKHSNFELVVNGHYKPYERVSPDGNEVKAIRGLAVSRRNDVYDDHRSVHQMLFNGQWAPHGGDGWLRLLEFLPDGETVRVWTVSPHIIWEKGDEAGWPTSPEMNYTYKLPPARKATTR
ncbi:metallophosphoesterase [Haloferula sargassicola]|uniref:Calcineurin-like phosphoesterase domain-containing protein n=1 Tax=Haloferula sargassicola TaxID=490096 RepID=A0ABP9UM41_9BACT